jgi:flagellar biosynthetic protein FliR
MLSLSGDWVNQYVVLTVLMSIRILGVFLAMPLFAFKALNMRLRVVVSLLLAYFVLISMPAVSQNVVVQDFSLLAVLSELGIGLVCGWVMRVGLISIDMLAEALSMQAGLSFAATFTHDPALASGLIGELLGMIALALAFALNVHLIFLEVMLQSFTLVPVGQWFETLSLDAVLKLLAQTFALGIVVAVPTFVVYYMFNMTQAILARVSPQMNLFSVGFAMMVPLAFAIIALLLPGFPDLVIRSLELPMSFIREHLGKIR